MSNNKGNSAMKPITAMEQALGIEEIVFMICSLLTLEDMMQLRLTSRSWHGRLQTLIFRTARVGVDPVGAVLFTDLAFSPFRDTVHTLELRRPLEGEFEFRYSDNALKATERAYSQLARATKRLKNIRKLVWKAGRVDPRWFCYNQSKNQAYDSVIANLPVGLQTLKLHCQSPLVVVTTFPPKPDYQAFEPPFGPEAYRTALTNEVGSGLTEFSLVVFDDTDDLLIETDGKSDQEIDYLPLKCDAWEAIYQRLWTDGAGLSCDWAGPLNVVPYLAVKTPNLHSLTLANGDGFFDSTLTLGSKKARERLAEEDNSTALPFPFLPGPLFPQLRTLRLQGHFVTQAGLLSIINTPTLNTVSLTHIVMVEGSYTPIFAALASSDKLTSLSVCSLVYKSNLPVKSARDKLRKTRYMRIGDSMRWSNVWNNLHTDQIPDLLAFRDALLAVQKNQKIAGMRVIDYSARQDQVHWVLLLAPRDQWFDAGASYRAFYGVWQWCRSYLVGLEKTVRENWHIHASV